MSYHSPEDDVHLYQHISGEYRCCRCKLNEPTEMEVENPIYGNEDIKDLDLDYDLNITDEFITIQDYGNNEFDNPEDVLEHLQEHREAGHHVSDSTFKRIKQETNER